MGIRTLLIIGGSIVAVVVVAVVVAIGATAAIGNRRWQARTDELHHRLERELRGRGADTYDPVMLDSLPAPVRRYLETVLTPGQPIIAAVEIQHSGTFNMDESGEQWRQFRSVQRVVSDRPGFVWNARILMALGITARVHDAYVAGTGILHAAVLGLIPVADVRNTPEMARGELMRFLAEAAWYPTVLLPGHGVTWQAVDESTADATLTDGEIAVTLRFFFGPDDLVERVYAESRARTVGGATEPAPWDGRFTNYQKRDGMLVPIDGDVGWVLPAGRHSYWRGHIKQVTYEYR